MAAMTGDQVVDRVRSICCGPVFGLIEVEQWSTFENQPSTNMDGVFRIPPMSSQWVHGQFNYVEDRTDSLQIWIARKPNGDYPTIRQRLLQDVHSLTAAIVRDAHEQSGDYAILDGGRGHAVLPEDRTKDFVMLRLTLPVNYESQL